MNTAENTPQCAACGKGGDGLKTCNGCKMVTYCNATCQKAHWQKHKTECKKRAAALLLESCEETAGLRFKVGDRVECNCDCGWMPGTIIKTLYRNVTWVDRVVPYQIQLDNGSHIYAPEDHDMCIRKAYDSPPTCWICFDDNQSETNVILRDCACRGGENGFVHVDCLVQLAIAKTENLESISGDDVNPFEYCITCKSPFSTCSRSISALANACYQLHCNDPIGSYWKNAAIRLMRREFSRNGDYSAAIKLLKNHIASIRLAIAGRTLVKSDLLINLFDFLKELADVHQETGSFEEMKVALDEMLVLVEKLESIGANVRRYRVDALTFQGRHAHLTGDKEAALECFEQCISIAREDGDGKSLRLSWILSNCAVLNLDLGNKASGIHQLEEVLDIKTTVYGRDYRDTVNMAESLRMLRNGSIDTVPPAELGLGDLEKRLSFSHSISATAETDATEIKSSASTNKGKRKGKKGKKKRR